MAGFFSPNCSRLATLLQTLRRVPFIIEDTFTFGDFNPQINWNGMTATNVVIYRARYLKIWKFLWLSLDFSATLAAPLTTTIGITLPENLTASSQTSGTEAGGGQYFSALIIDTPGNAIITNGNNSLGFSRAGFAAYAAASTRVIANGFIEVA